MPAQAVWHFIQWLHYLALSVWIGSITFLSAVAAPSVHRSMASRALAGEIVRAMLKRMNTIELTCGLLLIVTTFSALRFVTENRAWLAAIVAVILLMALLTSFYAFQTAPKMEAIKDRTPALQELSANQEDKAEFDRLHKLYVRLMGLNLLLGLCALYGSVVVLK